MKSCGGPICYLSADAYTCGGFISIARRNPTAYHPSPHRAKSAATRRREVRLAAAARRRSATSALGDGLQEQQLQRPPACTNSSRVEPFSRLKQPTTQATHSKCQQHGHTRRLGLGLRPCAVYGMLITEKRYRSTKKERGREAV